MIERTLVSVSVQPGSLTAHIWYFAVLLSSHLIFF